MTGQHATTARPIRTRPHALTGHPTPSQVLRDLRAHMPHDGTAHDYVDALVHEYDQQDDTTDEQLVRHFATSHGLSENYVRLALGMSTVAPEEQP